MELFDLASQVRIDDEDSALVIIDLAVVGTREDRNQLLHVRELVPIFNNLVRSTNQIQVLFLKELLDLVGAVHDRYSPVEVGRPALHVRRVRPQ